MVAHAVVSALAAVIISHHLSPVLHANCLSKRAKIIAMPREHLTTSKATLPVWLLLPLGPRA